jgi:transcriptional regulator with XRE-family HTH domain
MDINEGGRAVTQRGAGPSVNASVTETTWRAWMRDFGSHIRRVREFFGLSQEQLARSAGVSQGAVSRFESGRGLSTPLLVVLRINMALARAFTGHGSVPPSDDVTRFLRHMEFLELPPEPGAPPAPGGVPFQKIHLTPDLDLERLIRLYNDFPAARRKALMRVVDAAAQALRD